MNHSARHLPLPTLIDNKIIADPTLFEANSKTPPVPIAELRSGRRHSPAAPDDHPVRNSSFLGRGDGCGPTLFEANSKTPPVFIAERRSGRRHSPAAPDDHPVRNSSFLERGDGCGPTLLAQNGWRQHSRQGLDPHRMSIPCGRGLGMSHPKTGGVETGGFKSKGSATLTHPVRNSSRDDSSRIAHPQLFSG